MTNSGARPSRPEPGRMLLRSQYRPKRGADQRPSRIRDPSCCCGLRNARRAVGTVTSHPASHRGSRRVEDRGRSGHDEAPARPPFESALALGRRVALHRLRLPTSGLEGAPVGADEFPATPAVRGCLSPPTSPADPPPRMGRVEEAPEQRSCSRRSRRIHSLRVVLEAMDGSSRPWCTQRQGGPSIEGRAAA